MAAARCSLTHVLAVPGTPSSSRARSVASVATAISTSRRWPTYFGAMGVPSDSTPPSRYVTTAHGDRCQFGGRGRSSSAASATSSLGVLRLGVRAQDGGGDGRAHRDQLLEHLVARRGQVGQRAGHADAVERQVDAPEGLGQLGQAVGTGAGDEVDEHGAVAAHERAVEEARQHGIDDRPRRGLEEGQQRRRDGQAGEAHVHRRRATAGDGSQVGLVLAQPGDERSADALDAGPADGIGAVAAQQPDQHVRRQLPPPSLDLVQPLVLEDRPLGDDAPPARGAAATGSSGRSSGRRRGEDGRPAAAGSSPARRAATQAPTAASMRSDGDVAQGVGHDVGQRAGRRLGRVAPIGAEQRHRDELVPVRQ